jgi:hypothetical protein
MSKRGGDSTRVNNTKIKKRRGVGSRTFTVLDSDEENELPAACEEFALVTKTRVEISGGVERAFSSSVPVLEVEEPSSPVQLEGTVEHSADVVVENVILAVPARRRKKNDSVSDPSSTTPLSN